VVSKRPCRDIFAHNFQVTTQVITKNIYMLWEHTAAGLTVLCDSLVIVVFPSVVDALNTGGQKQETEVWFLYDIKWKVNSYNTYLMFIMYDCKMFLMLRREQKVKMFINVNYECINLCS
jgi:hypothetical protein